jgi:RimJ/RimL family protein N-acetyltransferase
MAADARFMRFLGEPPDPAAQLAHIRAHWELHGFGQFAVVERESGRVVGRSGASYHRLWPQDAEVGWGIEPDAWGRGYGTEAGAAAIAYAFDRLDVPRIVSIIHPENTASIRVAEKLGERPVATLPWDETGIELVVYGIERGEWSRLQSSG